MIPMPCAQRLAERGAWANIKPMNRAQDELPFSVGSIASATRSNALAMSENRVGHAAISRSHASSTRSGSVRTERAMNHEA